MPFIKVSTLASRTRGRIQVEVSPGFTTLKSSTSVFGFTFRNQRAMAFCGVEKSIGLIRYNGLSGCASGSGS